MTALYYTLGVVIFIVAILASIGLHELGHMIPAKKFGGKVTQYFIGFGPTVWSKRVGETEYGVKGVPLGGYVKIVGMLPPQKGTDRLRESSTGLFTQLISDARAAEAEHVQPGDEDRLFYKMSWWKKVVVMAGGPTVNILIAFGIFLVVFGTYGNPGDVRISPVVDHVEACVVPADEDGRVCTASDPVSPAKLAGLQVGDRITAFNGTEITGWKQLQSLIRANDDGAAKITVLRDGAEQVLTTNTTVALRPTSETDDTKIQVGFLGFTPHAALGTGGPLYTVEQMGTMTKQTVVALGSLPVKVFGVAKAIVGAEPRDPQGPVSIVGGGRLAGETVSQAAFPLADKAVFLLMLIAGFNFFIGMFNFIPLLPLDGGHIAGALWEAARRAFARLRGRPDPGYVDVAKLLPIAYVVASALLVMGVVLIVGDLVVPVHLYS
ncbi:membrane-associated protease RseP (regulator of RpoE activity) [Nocardioides ginsengisegetis]|uniref:Membrane-associated protease RseP (Regulator of RpoE activity) n=1 Tax=Nocardioides ginsengisegetis TaxID=661491 RepID=A0A7W3J0J1_9ACTN|nr:site-2 protease family protein [Nocardioides ginsengisegetis]MBA8804066.1 membrane-associated protease RseP (regulator of RpoE activity) [Nocardioides ginsengisegetis]